MGAEDKKAGSKLFDQIKRDLHDPWSHAHLAVDTMQAIEKTCREFETQRDALLAAASALADAQKGLIDE